MLHATMKTFLQRRLRDTAGTEFDSTAIVDPLLAFGIAKLQAIIHDFNPSAFIATNTFATVAATDLYDKQASSMRVIRAEILNATTGKYVKLPMRNFLELIDEASGDFIPGDISIADLGTQWFIHPTPDSAKTIRVWYVPIITTSAGWDAVATRISPALHLLPVDFALVEAFAESSERIAVAEARVRIKEAIELIPGLYGRSNEQVSQLSMSPY
jgi:hypothetical protein